MLTEPIASTTIQTPPQRAETHFQPFLTNQTASRSHLLGTAQVEFWHQERMRTVRCNRSPNDPYFWRPHSITDQMSNITTLTYIGQNAVESSLPVNGSSTVDQLTTLDSLGRSQILQTKEAPAS